MYIRGSIASLALLSLVSGCKSSKSASESPQVASKPRQVEKPSAHESKPAEANKVSSTRFSQPIGGTTLELDMLPVPSTDSSAPSIWMSSTEVTWDLFDAYLFKLDVPEEHQNDVDAFTRPSKPYINMDRGFGRAGFPVISVSYKSAGAFCVWLSAKTGRKYRLPTENEWERACRAGTNSTWSFGEVPSVASDYAWFKDNSDNATHAVATKKPNAWGFFDMHGNAIEWCTGSDGKPVVRGGSFRDTADGLRCDSRVLLSDAWNRSDPQIPKSKWWLADGGFVGFRVVCEGTRENK